MITYILIGIILFYLIVLLRYKANTKPYYIKATIFFIAQLVSLYCFHFIISMKENPKNYPDYFYADSGIVKNHIAGFERSGKISFYKERLLIEYKDASIAEEVNSDTFKKYKDDDNIVFYREKESYYNSLFLLKLCFFIMFVLCFFKNFKYIL